MLSAIRNGYIGSTSMNKERQIVHTASRNSTYLIEIKIPNVINLEKSIEHIIIKLINKLNFKNNLINAASYLVKGLNDLEHLFIGLYYIKSAFNIMINEIDRISTARYILDPEDCSSSQETIRNLSDSYKLELVDFNDIKDQITPFNQLTNGNNCFGKCISVPHSNQHYTVFTIQDENKNVFKVNIDRNIDESHYIISQIIIENCYYYFPCVQLIFGYSINKAKGYKIFINDLKQIKEIFNLEDKIDEKGNHYIFKFRLIFNQPFIFFKLKASTNKNNNNSAPLHKPQGTTKTNKSQPAFDCEDEDNAKPVGSCADENNNKLIGELSN